jgi:hypothetical protein
LARSCPNPQNADSSRTGPVPCTRRRAKGRGIAWCLRAMAQNLWPNRLSYCFVCLLDCVKLGCGGALKFSHFPPRTWPGTSTTRQRRCRTRTQMPFRNSFLLVLLASRLFANPQDRPPQATATKSCRDIPHLGARSVSGFGEFARNPRAKTRALKSELEKHIVVTVPTNTRF